MKIYSFCEDREGFQTVEVELALWPGLPSIQFLGLPDSHIKEASLRIKSAIRSAGYQFPIAQQIVVNLKPTALKKSSRGIELAVALAYLWATEQIPKPLDLERLYIYGGLSLYGQVESVEGTDKISLNPADLLVTGILPTGRSVKSAIWMLGHLQDSGRVEVQIPENTERQWRRPQEFAGFRFSSSEARLLSLAALGGHHMILAGPAGGGKSTMAQVIHSLLTQPAGDSDLDLGLSWPPLIQPHHSTPLAAMLGGGSYPIHGEISRAHRGVLVLDELLEFERGVLESLREPFEQEKIRVSRLSAQKFFPVQTQIIATTNLCPCGKYMPKKMMTERCRFSLRKCRTYSERLSGPLVDRFQILHFCEPARSRGVGWDQILRSIECGQKFQRDQGRTQPNRRLGRQMLTDQLEDAARSLGFENPSGSERRTLATLRVARSLADLDGSLSIRMSHIDEALTFAMEPFDQLERLFL